MRIQYPILLLDILDHLARVIRWQIYCEEAVISNDFVQLANDLDFEWEDFGGWLR
jgi:hypothetical protein